MRSSSNKCGRRCGPSFIFPRHCWFQMCTRNSRNHYESRVEYLKPAGTRVVCRGMQYVWANYLARSDKFSLKVFYTITCVTRWVCESEFFCCKFSVGGCILFLFKGSKIYELVLTCENLCQNSLKPYSKLRCDCLYPPYHIRTLVVFAVYRVTAPCSYLYELWTTCSF